MSRVLSGLRPTGRLHLGHLVGVLSTLVKLQKDNESYFMIADWHALTTQYKDTSSIKDNSYTLLTHSIAVGIDPEKNVIFCQSDIKEHLELAFIFSCFVPLGWLFRNPTYKEQLKELKETDLFTYGFLGYPVLQAADILTYKAELIPIGEDQKPHLELTREIARKFNSIWGETFYLPEPVFSHYPRLPGTDNRKMSKSYNNCIYLDDEEEELKNKVQNMFTDPRRIYISDEGHPEECPVFKYHSVFSGTEKDNIKESCKAARIGCVACKSKLAEILKDYLYPIREKIIEIREKKKMQEEILEEGKKLATNKAKLTLEEVKSKIGI